MLRSRKTRFITCLVVFCVLNHCWVSSGWCIDPIDALIHPPLPISEEERATLGNVGIARTFFMPERELDTFAGAKGIGAAKGAVEGFIQTMGHARNCSGEACLPVFIWAATVGSVYGAIQGYIDALGAEEAQRVERALEELCIGLNVQEQLRRKILKIAGEEAAKNLIPIEDYGPSVPGEKVNYGTLRKRSVDSILEISVLALGFKTWPRELEPPEDISVGGEDPSLALFLNTRPRLIRLSDNTVVYQPRKDIESAFMRRSEWGSNDYELFSDEMDKLTEILADNIVDDIFITYVLPEESPTYSSPEESPP